MYCLPHMAQVFPLNPDDSSLDEPQQALAATLAGLPFDWTLLRDRCLGGEPIDGVLVHPGIGIAVVALAPHDAAAAAAELRSQLDRERFSEFFPGELPIVALTLTAAEIPEIGERLAAEFEAAAPLDIADKDWADGVIELLLVPSDVSMMPTGGMEAFAVAPVMAADAAPAIAAPIERRPYVLEDTPPPVEERHARSFALHAGTSAIFDFRPAQRRRWAAIAAAAAAIITAIGLAAWGLDEHDADWAPGATGPQAQLAMPSLTPPSAAPAPQATTGQEPPAVPEAPPVMLAAKPLDAPPPTAPRPTQVAALPDPKPPIVMAEKPLAAPPPAAPHPTQVAALPTPKPPIVMAEKSPAALPPAAPQPTRVAPLPEPKPAVAAAAPPPAPPVEAAQPTEPARGQHIREAANVGAAPAAPDKAAKPRRAPPEKRRVAKADQPAEPQQLMQREIDARQDRPPVDASDLPPLDTAAPAPPAETATQQTIAVLPPPARSSTPPIGPPVQLVRSQASAPAGLSGSPVVPVQAAANTPAPPSVQRECRPYTSDTTLSGRSLRVEGIACRGPDGQWRLVSEAPIR